MQTLQRRCLPLSGAARKGLERIFQEKNIHSIQWLGMLST